MIIIMVLVVMWAVVLAPAAVRKIRSLNSDHSISSFHQSLDLLESSGPKAFAPAFRLAGSVSDEPTPRLVPQAPAEPLQPRPQLVLLRPPGQGGVDPMSDRYEYHDEYDDYEDGSYDAYGEADGYASEFDGYYDDYGVGRSPAALRRRNILFGLAGAVLVTGLLGFMMATLWDATLLAFVLLVAYVGLMAYAATRGDISLSKSSAPRASSQERHVARAVVPGHGRAFPQQDAWYDDDAVAPEPHYGVAADQFEDEWWDEPRQAVAR